MSRSEKYHQENLDVTLKGSTLRMKHQYESLKNKYLIVTGKVRSLEDEVSKLKLLLLEHGVDIWNEEQF